MIVSHNNMIICWPGRQVQRPRPWYLSECQSLMLANWCHISVMANDNIQHKHMGRNHL